MSRTYVITGSASGMGAATQALLQSHGARVIGVDRRNAEVTADLGTAEGRAAMLKQVQELTGSIDAVIACAGIGGGTASDLGMLVSVNYFGALATLEGLRHMLSSSDSPRAVAVSSVSAVVGHLETGWNDELVEACLAGDESRAIATARNCSGGPEVYTSAKRALIRWIRRASSAKVWAGAGIPLNVIAPGMVRTPINDYLFSTPEIIEKTARIRTQPLGWGKPEQVASLLAWLTSSDNEFVTGQLICIDGGWDAYCRPDVV